MTDGDWMACISLLTFVLVWKMSILPNTPAASVSEFPLLSSFINKEAERV